MASASQIPKRNLGRQSWSPRPTEATLVVPSSGPMWASAPTERRGGSRNHPGQRRTAERLRCGREEMGGNCGRDHPQRDQQRRTIPQSWPSAMPAPFTQGSLRDGGYGSPRRPVGPPRNDNGFLSFRGQCAHWPWESVLSYDGRGTGVRAAESSAPTENPINHPSQPARSEASAPAAARDGRESAQRPSQKGERPRDRLGSA